MLSGKRFTPMNDAGRAELHLITGAILLRNVDGDSLRSMCKTVGKHAQTRMAAVYPIRLRGLDASGRGKEIMRGSCR
jgi:hypothetical protein